MIDKPATFNEPLHFWSRLFLLCMVIEAIVALCLPSHTAAVRLCPGSPYSSDDDMPCSASAKLSQSKGPHAAFCAHAGGIELANWIAASLAACTSMVWAAMGLVAETKLSSGFFLDSALCAVAIALSYAMARPSSRLNLVISGHRSFGVVLIPMITRLELVTQVYKHGMIGLVELTERIGGGMESSSGGEASPRPSSGSGSSSNSIGGVNDGSSAGAAAMPDAPSDANSTTRRTLGSRIRRFFSFFRDPTVVWQTFNMTCLALSQYWGPSTAAYVAVTLHVFSYVSGLVPISDKFRPSWSLPMPEAGTLHALQLLPVCAGRGNEEAVRFLHEQARRSVGTGGAAGRSSSSGNGGFGGSELSSPTSSISSSEDSSHGSRSPDDGSSGRRRKGKGKKRREEQIIDLYTNIAMTFLSLVMVVNLASVSTDPLSPDTVSGAELAVKAQVVTICCEMLFCILLPLLRTILIAAGYREVVKLRRMEREERRRRETLGRFLRTVFHEQRAPQQSIALGLELLSDWKTLPEAEVNELLAMMRLSCATSSTILNSVLSLSAMESGRFDLHLAPTALGPVASQVCFQLRPWAESSRADIVLQMDPRLPRTLLCDGPRISQCLTNLATNALKFVPSDGSGRVVIALQLAQPAAIVAAGQPIIVRFSVIDNGPGISLEKQALLFQPFVQLTQPSQRHSSQSRQPQSSGPGSRSGGGIGGGRQDRVPSPPERLRQRMPVSSSGLGLSITKQIVEKHGGHIGVDSSPGRGSTFFFDLPLLVVPDGDQQRTPTAASASAAAAAAGSAGTGSAAAPSATAASTATAAVIRTEELAGTGATGSARSSSSASSSASPEADSAANDDGATGDHGQLRMLVVDDSLSNRRLLVRLLKRSYRSFCVVDEAGDGAEAVAMVRAALQHGQQRYDCVLMDGQMPQLDGYAATAQIRRLLQQQPPQNDSTGQHNRLVIIGVTGNALDEDVRAFRDAGADDVLIKPIGGEALFATIERRLQSPLLAR